MDLETLKRKVLKTKKDLKDWEAVFAKKHGRPPTVRDVSDRPNIGNKRRGLCLSFELTLSYREIL